MWLFNIRSHPNINISNNEIPNLYNLEHLLSNNITNYILYNFKDTPENFYKRLKINIDLNKEFAETDTKTTIYSFPMRYVPLNAKKRNMDTGNRYWNEKYLRAVKIILNVTKGPVMPGEEFFMQAFGQNIEDFKTNLLLPEAFILNRLVKDWRDKSSLETQQASYVRDWKEGYRSLSKSEKSELIGILGPTNRENLEKAYNKVSKKIGKLLKDHIESEDIIRRCKK